MFAIINKILDWFKSLFWKEGEAAGPKRGRRTSYQHFHPNFLLFAEMELTLVGLQYSGKDERGHLHSRIQLIFLCSLQARRLL